jgi:hypothetical protein
MITLKRIDGSEIGSYDVATVKEAVESVILRGVDLRAADLSDAKM